MSSGSSSRIAAAALVARAIPSRAAWRGAIAAAVLGISACSTGNVLDLRPDVDVGTTAGLPRGGGMQDLVPGDPYLQQAEAAQQPEEAPEAVQDVAMSEPISGGPALPDPGLAPRSLDEQAAAIEPGYPTDIAISRPPGMSRPPDASEPDMGDPGATGGAG